LIFNIVVPRENFLGSLGGPGFRMSVSGPRFVGHGFTACGKTPQMCHSEERSDQESLCFLAFSAERFLASLGMTPGKAFFRNLFSRWRFEF
jgi:hypothetical protein